MDSKKFQSKRLEDAFACIELMKVEGNYEGQKVGIFTKHVSGKGIGGEGDIVLYREEDNGKLCVEEPFSPETIKDYGEETPWFRLYGDTPIINVPKECVKEVKRG